MVVDTENRLKLGCTLSPASLIVSPWTGTWSMTVAQISSHFLFLLLLLFLGGDMCSLFVFDCCHLCLPVWMTCIRVQNVFENENVSRVLLKSLSEICKLYGNSLRY